MAISNTNPGSSRIPEISSVIFGEGDLKGPTGPTGPTGTTGSSSTGPDGSVGKGVFFAEGISADTMMLSLGFVNGGNVTDITYKEISGVQGNTGNLAIGSYTVGFTGVTENSFYLNTDANGFTFYFKSIDFKGNIAGEYVNNNLKISTIENSEGGNFFPGSLLFIGADFLSGFYNIQSATNTLYTEKTYSGLTYSSLDLTMRAFIESNANTNFNEFKENSQNTSIDIDAGFYGISYAGENNISFSQPFLKYNTTYITEDTAAPTTEIINFETKNNYNKRIGSNTFVPLNEKIGSCCYCDVNGKRECHDYVNRNYCIYTLTGNWSSIPCYQRYNTEDCYPGGACCVNGICVGSSARKCADMGGFFVIGENCSTIGVCPDRCVADIGCCCYNGIGYPLTEELCGEIAGARFFNSPCTSVDCCRVGYVGACCKNKICYDDFTGLECAATGGIFQGPGSECISQFLNCCTEPGNPEVDYVTVVIPPDGETSTPNYWCVEDFAASWYTTLILSEDKKVYTTTNIGHAQVPSNLNDVGLIATTQLANCVWELPTLTQPNGKIVCWGDDSHSVARYDYDVGLQDIVKSIVIADGRTNEYNSGVAAALFENKNAILFPSSTQPTGWNANNIKKISRYQTQIYALHENGTVTCSSVGLNPPCLTFPDNGQIADMWLSTTSIGGGTDGLDLIAVKLNGGQIKIRTLNGWQNLTQITPTGIKDIVGAGNSIIGLYDDGHVECFNRSNNNPFNLCSQLPTSLQPFVKIKGANFHLVLERSNGVLIALGNNQYQQCDVGDYNDQLLCENP